MTDRELLELAAKAIGFGNDRPIWTESEHPKGSGRHGALWNGRGHGYTSELWNPLTDDGDALRLAVKLGMCVTAFTKTEDAMVGYRIGDDGRNIEESWGTDPYAATRRAIVRAAAEIGKAMR